MKQRQELGRSAARPLGSPRLWCVGARAPLDGLPSPQAVVLLPYCAGDANVDGTVDAVDRALVIGAWGSNWTQGDGCEVASPDFDQSGMVDGIDLAIVLGGWGPCCPTFSSGLPFGAGLALQEEAPGLPSAGGASDPKSLVAILGFPGVQSLSAWLDGATSEQRDAMAAALLSVVANQAGGEQ